MIVLNKEDLPIVGAITECLHNTIILLNRFYKMVYKDPHNPFAWTVFKRDEENVYIIQIRFFYSKVTLFFRVNENTGRIEVMMKKKTEDLLHHFDELYYIKERYFLEYTDLDDLRSKINNIIDLDMIISKDYPNKEYTLKGIHLNNRDNALDKNALYYSVIVDEKVVKKDVPLKKLLTNTGYARLNYFIIDNFKNVKGRQSLITLDTGEKVLVTLQDKKADNSYFNIIGNFYICNLDRSKFNIWKSAVVKSVFKMDKDIKKSIELSKQLYIESKTSKPSMGERVRIIY